MSSTRRAILQLLAAALASGTLSTATAGSSEDWARMRSIVPRGYVCQFTDKPLRIDGRLDDPALPG